MKLRLAARGVELTADLEDYVGRRVHFRLGRFAGKIRSLIVRLHDVNGPRGGVDKSCDVRVDLGPGQEVVVRERQATIQAAVAFALDRAERAVGRQLKSGLASPGMDSLRAAESGD